LDEERKLNIENIVFLEIDSSLGTDFRYIFFSKKNKVFFNCFFCYFSLEHAAHGSGWLFFKVYFILKYIKIIIF